MRPPERFSGAAIAHRQGRPKGGRQVHPRARLAGRADGPSFWAVTEPLEPEPQPIFERTFARWLARNPHEATTLGVRDHDAALPDASPEGRRAEREEVGALRRDVASAPVVTADDELDRAAWLRVLEHTERVLESEGDAESLEPSLLPYAALAHQALRVTTSEHAEAFASRMRAVPGYLAQREVELAGGAARGRGFDRDVGDTFAEIVLPGAATGVLRLAEAVAARAGASDELTNAARLASEAFAAHGAAVSGLLERARPCVVLGEEEASRRLSATMGLSGTASSLVAKARAALQGARRDMLERAKALGLRVARVEEVADAVAGLFARKLDAGADIPAMYRAHAERALERFVDVGLLSPVGEINLGFDPLPEGIAEGSQAVNWPAPLLDPTGRGHVAYAPRPSAHVAVACKSLAIHEAVPGHYLQSRVWQLAHGHGRHAGRFIGVADDVAMVRGYMGTMVAVEGWAVRAEQLARTMGLFDDEEELFFSVCEAIRAARAVVDIELHAGEMTRDEAARFTAWATLLPEAWAQRQVVRYRRMPLQACTYWLGALAIERAAARRTGSMAAFHDELLSRGPVPPGPI
jgi:uncharacterized protein (DUF885 family)